MSYCSKLDHIWLSNVGRSKNEKAALAIGGVYLEVPIDLKLFRHKRQFFVSFSHCSNFMSLSRGFRFKEKKAKSDREKERGLDPRFFFFVLVSLSLLFEYIRWRGAWEAEENENEPFSSSVRKMAFSKWQFSSWTHGQCSEFCARPFS